MILEVQYFIYAVISDTIQNASFFTILLLFVSFFPNLLV